MTANEAMKEALELLGIDNAVEEPLNEEERNADKRINNKRI